ncbi:DUF397 domain-containing protein [Kitasatospora sp. NPDC089509]|uniref:DUF397 domain-containing protein n=1 Tax=Kitasatospora sp. NPDC089509 TaxID=3364079 RepID=UPI00380EB3AB
MTAPRKMSGGPQRGRPAEDPSGPTLTVPRDAWTALITALITALKTGELPTT